MLAASLSGSNVPPDNLQPAPLAGLATRAPERFRKPPARPGPQSYPAPATQQHAVGLEPPRQPFAVGSEHRERTVGVHAQRDARGPAAAQRPELCADGDRPGGGRAQAQQKRRLESRDNNDAYERYGHGGPVHEAAQGGIRYELGEVFVR